MDLPTVQECHEFMDAINRGRQAIGLEPIEKLEYDKCEPNLPGSCLSAHHLFAPAGGLVYCECVQGILGDTCNSLATALDVVPISATTMEIPPAIRRVTDPFDGMLPGLRERLVEAGLVDDVPTKE